MVGCAARTSFAGHANRSADTERALTFKPDHPTGAGQKRPAGITTYICNKQKVIFGKHPNRCLYNRLDLICIYLEVSL